MRISTVLYNCARIVPDYAGAIRAISDHVKVVWVSPSNGPGRLIECANDETFHLLHSRLRCTVRSDGMASLSLAILTLSEGPLKYNGIVLISPLASLTILQKVEK